MKLIMPVIVAMTALCTVAVADTVVLRDGGAVTGVVLSKGGERLVIDLGFTVLTIPMEAVLDFRQAEAPDPNSAAAYRKETGQLYVTGGFPPTTIERGVGQVAESVVMVETPAGLGSGFFINPDGYMITNFHVIERETRIEVTVFQQTGRGLERLKFRQVRIVAFNPFVDLALLKVEDLGETKVTYARLGDISRVRVGETVFAIGSPMGMERSVSQGVVSTLNREFSGHVYIQTTAPINPGNSGGPLFNLSGEVVGVTNMGYVQLDGLGFAIPVDYVKHFLHNRDAFAYDRDNPNTGFRYLQPGRRRNMAAPEPEVFQDTRGIDQ
ncbi:MAG TPA: trypsin-like peptidase domain-containing protein [Sedimentisphaerales bacterium]|nr:trypsin-like peptidase domain-containing protein [Sedimentisphaerales bacterium]